MRLLTNTTTSLPFYIQQTQSSKPANKDRDDHVSVAWQAHCTCTPPERHDLTRRRNPNTEKDYSWLAELSLAAQARLVREWDGNTAKLEVFMDIIAGLVAGDDQFAVRVLCEGLIANTNLRPLQRARTEI